MDEVSQHRPFGVDSNPDAGMPLFGHRFLTPLLVGVALNPDGRAFRFERDQRRSPRSATRADDDFDADVVGRLGRDPLSRVPFSGDRDRRGRRGARFVVRDGLGHPSGRPLPGITKRWRRVCCARSPT